MSFGDLKTSITLFRKEARQSVTNQTYRWMNVNPVSNEGLSHFLIACFVNDVHLVKELLESGVAELEASINCALKNTNKEMPNDNENNPYYKSELVDSDHISSLRKFSGYRALHMAVEGQASEVLELLLNFGADTRARNTAGLTPLQLALQLADRNEVSKAIAVRLAKSANESSDGLTMFHISCILKDTIAIREAVETGVDINSRLSTTSPIWPGSTALHILLKDYNNREPEFLDHDNDESVGFLYHYNKSTCALGEVIKLLVQKGANVNQLNSENLSPIHLAYKRNCLQMVKLMLESSCILDSNPVDDEGFSHFHIACYLAEDNLVEDYLVRGLADVNYPKDYFAKSSYAGFTPIHYAFASGNFPAARVLLRHGANVRAEDRLASTVLHIIPFKLDFSRKQIHTNAIFKCIEANANLNAVDIFGRTPLEMYLKLRDNIGYLIRFLVKNGAGVTHVNPVSGQGLLSLANKFLLKIILEHAKDITDIDRVTGFNAIHNIVSSNFVNISSFELYEVIEKLTQKGCDINKQDVEGKTPLHVAMFWKRSDISVKTILRFGADINIVDNYGNTPLAYCNYSHDIVQRPLFAHVYTILHFGLYLNSANLRLFKEWRRQHNFKSLLRYDDEHENWPEEIEDSEIWNSELKLARTKTIFENYTSADLLCKTTVKKCPKLSRPKREAIANYKFSNMYCFENLGGLLRLQHRRCLIRMQIMESAQAALHLCVKQFLSNFKQLPDLCSELIIDLLSNEDLITLIEIMN